jgi:hypothetical protein
MSEKMRQKTSAEPIRSQSVNRRDDEALRRTTISARMKAGFQPYGRVSARSEPRRGAGWDLRVAVLMVFPVICLVVVLYEFLYLQEYAGTGAPDAPVEDRSVHLRADQELPAVTAAPEPTEPPSIVNGRSTIVLVANYRDSTRCSETLRSIFDNAAEPDNIRISIYDQIYPAENERQCVDVFCELMGDEYCRRSQIVSSQIDAVNATVSEGDVVRYLRLC